MHQWNVTVPEALDIQKHLARSVIASGNPAGVKLVAGVDMAFRKTDTTGYCAIVLLSYPGLEIIEESCIKDEVIFPYVPGLLSFREGPIFLKAYERLKSKPDVVVFDGQGIAHPRGMGIASHMGLWLGIPAIGCAKSRLYGSCEEPVDRKGAYTYLFDGHGRIIGVILRTRKGVKPIIISPGHLIGIQESLDIILNCTLKYRIPEPTRIAHVRAGAFKKIIQ